MHTMPISDDLAVTFASWVILMYHCSTDLRFVQPSQEDPFLSNNNNNNSKNNNTTLHLTQQQYEKIMIEVVGV